MADIRSNSLAVFGEIDRQVVESEAESTAAHAQIVALVEKLMPYSTGLGRQGWFRELQEFLGSRPMRRSRSPFEFPSIAQAREELTRTPRPRRSWTDVAAKEDRNPARARAAFGLVTLERIKQLRGDGIDETLSDVLTGLVEPWPVPAEPLVPRDGPRDPASNASYLLENIDRVTDRESWKVLAAEAVSPEFANDSLPCFGTLEDAGGQYCSTLYTECCDDDITVDQVKAIIHPANWHLCYPKFFQSMTKQQPYFTSDGWCRILEEISAEPEYYTLKTALIFSLENSDNGFYINYQLDPNRQGEDKCIGIVEIDNGYVWVTPKPDGTGVRVRTSKEERVNGLSPTATAALGCQLGWGDSAYEMIIAAARKATNGDFNPNKKPVEGWPMGAQSKKPVDTGPNVTFPPVPATLPINFADGVKDGAELLTSLIKKVSSNTGDAASRWLDGTVKTDVEEVTTQMGKDLKEWSLEVYEKAERNVKPPKDVTP
ncbi:hypothetical protein [Mycolicibacterium arseniciresistens]|uniref:Uncharacterized protein n=1 Tax=Mycolicibacterium arseniciresistens TaxID=3062257 RepID=A0ABT8UIQ2_9MYCO|nr:hypothetical protein [Mycolicibacterium arseniciresistens]MDO3637658.1 hypothetical protein [Mycolicibacterium arseniciresistens]